jgi:hypothetical protein
LKQHPKLRTKPAFESRVPEDIGKRTADSIARWAASNPNIRRAWMYGNFNVAVELEPVGDSEETLAAWMAKAGLWRAQLQSRMSAPVDLEWFDPDGSTALDEARVLVYERAAD